MGRERSSGEVGEVGEERDEDNFLCLARDWRVCCCDRLAKPSNEGDLPRESICLWFGIVGPAFGGRWLYCDSLECGSIKKLFGCCQWPQES